MMNKMEFINEVAKKTGFPKSQVRETLDTSITVVSDTLKKGGQVALTGFGTFTVFERKARTGRNPRTGAPLKIPAARVPKFRAGKGLRQAVK